jgi:hypothetical protein
MTNHLGRIQTLLVEEANGRLNELLQAVGFTGEAAVDTLLNDLIRYPHVFVFVCLIDAQSRSGSELNRLTTASLMLI